MSWAEILEAPPPPPKLRESDILGKAVYQYMSGMVGQATETDTIRASSVHFMCPREFVLQYWQPKINKKFVPRVQMTVDMGTSFHERMQNHVLGPMGVLYGDWYSSKLPRTVKNSFYPSVESFGYSTYVEMALQDTKYNLSGHIDGLISLKRVKYFVDNAERFKKNPDEVLNELFTLSHEDKDLVIIDLKSVSQRNFDLADSGVPDYYQTQFNLYMHMAKIDEVYCLTTERENFSMKGKRYPKDEKVLKDALRKVKTVNNAIVNETLPESYMPCLTPKDKRAKACAHCLNCFDSKFDFKKYVAQGKEIAEKTGRKLLSLKIIE